MTQKFGRFSFSLGSDNDLLSLLFGLLDQILGSLGLLLGNLFLFDGPGEFGSETEVSDGHIVKHNVEISQSNLESLLDGGTNHLSLSDQLVGVVEGHHRLEDLVDNGGQNSTIIVKTQVSVDGEDCVCLWSEQDSQTDVDGLQIYSKH